MGKFLPGTNERSQFDCEGRWLISCGLDLDGDRPCSWKRTLPARPESGGRQVQGPGDESRQFLCKFVPGFDPDRRGRPLLHHAVIRIISRRITHFVRSLKFYPYINRRFMTSKWFWDRITPREVLIGLKSCCPCRYMLTIVLFTSLLKYQNFCDERFGNNSLKR